MSEDAYESYVEFQFHSTMDAKTRTVTYAANDEVPPFDELVHDFLNWATAVYEWDRKDIRFKALEALGNWEA